MQWTYQKLRKQAEQLDSAVQAVTDKEIADYTVLLCV